MAFMTPNQAKAVPRNRSKVSRNYALYASAVGLGCRLGELLAPLGLTSTLRKAPLHVRRSLSQVRQEFIVKEPKSRSGRRTRHAPKVRDHRTTGPSCRRPKAGLIAAPVFCTKNGTYFNKTNVRREFLALVKRANETAREQAAEKPTEPDLIPASLRFHDLRHTHASCLIAPGHSIKAVSLPTPRPRRHHNHPEDLFALDAG